MKTLSIGLGLIILGLIISFFFSPNALADSNALKPVYEGPQQFIGPLPSPKVETPRVAPYTASQHISRIFGDQAPLMTAIFKAESGLNPQAKGYNCFYEGKSKACKIEDRPNAWSVDCGISQINTRGTICPAKLLDVEYNLLQAKKKLDTEGLGAWVVYTQGKHLKYL